ncbi:PepSY domain-containing protein [Streptomyces xiaopingdaonensis]|uniref:PepSY domain-containing protein n=1 Tax=Streptomyces xiaopingdaonensis TaxID=1565415 RepID=UPI0002FC5D0A|nr:PepSY domain-containing protein [Streptomyces xiaopingdaonensis]
MQLKRFTRRNTVLAGVAAAVLVGGGASAVAFSGGSSDGGSSDGGSSDGGSSAQATAGSQRAQAGASSLDREDRGDVRISATGAVDRVLKAVPGDVTELELDHDDGRYVWEADVLGKGGGWHEVTLDADSGRLLEKHKERADDAEERAAHRAKAKHTSAAFDGGHVDARDALSTAEKYGTATELDLERVESGRGGAVWEIETADGSGVERTVLVGLDDGKVKGVETEQKADGDEDDD